MRLKRNALRYLYLAIVFVAVFSLCPQIVRAQEEEEEDTFMLEDIVVVAEKREADIQKTPIAISAVDQEHMVRAGVFQLHELDKLIPDLNITQFAAFDAVTIREVVIGEFSPIMETTTAVHIDNVIIPRNTSMENMFFDLERVEVLKGPQGTLHGKSATAGSINVITRKPVIGFFGGHAEVEYGEFDRLRFEGAINIPISDNVALRTAYRSLEFDSMNDAGFNNQDTRSARVSLLWEPNERSSLLITADFSNEDRGASRTGEYFNTYGSLTTTTPVDSPWASEWVLGDYGENQYAKTETWGVMAQYDYEFDFATLTAQYGHRSVRTDQEAVLFGGTSISWFPPGPPPFGDLPVTAVTFGPQLDPATGEVAYNPWFSNMDGDSDSLEVLLASNTSGAQGDTWEWVVGANVLNDKSTEVATFVDYWASPENDTLAFFGQATWTPIERWHFTGGYRYTMDDKSICVRQGLPLSPPTLPSECNTHEYSADTYKGVVSYDVSDVIMTYLQYSRGYKVGNLDVSLTPIPSEYLSAYEWGLKSRFLDNRLQANLDVYYYEYEDYNRFFSGGACLSDVNGDHYCDDLDFSGFIEEDEYAYQVTGTTSAGGSEQKGASLSLMWLITSKDRMGLNVAYTHNRFKDYNLQGAILAMYPDFDDAYTNSEYADQTGREYGGSPWRGNMSYTHTFHVGETGTLDVTGDLYYEGKGIDQVLLINTAGEYSMPGRDDYWLGDISARYSSTYGMPPGMMWHVRAWVNNVWDSTDMSSISYSAEHFILGVGSYPPMSGTISGSYVMPRTWGIAIGANW